MTLDDYRCELPDFILGKASPETAATLERLIETNPAFRAEFLEMKAFIEQTKPMLDAAFAKPSEARLESLSKRILAQTKPRKRAWWEVVKDDFRSLFAGRGREWSGALAGASLALSLIVGAAWLDEELKREAQTRNPMATSSAIATKAFALGISPESLASQLGDEELETALSALESDLPARSSRYEILTDDDVENLFKPL
ncbi:MAG: hypothetical protein NZM06_03205 [Chloroherpetonaceae bacterium]|nr:hypothetical protein [Chloroherpetonaceae bacterium]MDW8436985.1 hypothetical protein [Chloroherpetonaceae bacterium]